MLAVRLRAHGLDSSARREGGRAFGPSDWGRGRFRRPWQRALCGRCLRARPRICFTWNTGAAVGRGPR
ncbi:hypothetical protein HMPREF1317_1397 [Schaalia georgiae F0490]|uniref:Uncharacterized protein n=1 Tax=Schaalia georgiae F0490 TaxID=1125717 RepID=J0WZA9_9ACTO|nr:hypothetical protein HMPREF1317_1397 [Schaalia georgiae F0490]